MAIKIGSKFVPYSGVPYLMDASSLNDDKQFLDRLLYKDVWDASGGAYPVAPHQGDYYVVDVEGVIDGVDYKISDWMIYNGSSWNKLSSSGDTPYIPPITNDRFSPFSGVYVYTGGLNSPAFENVTMAGSLAIVASSSTDPTMVIYDITDQQNPKLLGQINLSGTYKIAVQGDYAYVPGINDSTLYIVKFNDPTNPTIVGSLAITGGVGALQNCVVFIDHCYIATENKGLTIVDVSDPTTPVQVYQEGGVDSHSFGICGELGNICVTYYQDVAPWTVRFLKIWDATNPLSPTVVNTYTFPTNTKPQGISSFGTHFFVTDTNQNRIHILDVNSLNPLYVSYITPTGTLGKGFTAQASGPLTNYIYIPSGSTTNGKCIDFYDISSAATPKKIASLEGGIGDDIFGGIAVHNNYIYAASYGASSALGNGSAFEVYTTATEIDVAGNLSVGSLYVKNQVTIPNGSTATTQTTTDSSDKVATDEFVHNVISTLTKNDVGLSNVTNDAQVKQSERATLTSISDKIAITGGSNSVIGSGTSVGMYNERQLAHTVDSEIITGYKKFINGVEFGANKKQIFFASYLNSIDADFALGNKVATSVGNAGIYNAWLDLGHNDVRYVKYLNFNTNDVTVINSFSAEFDYIPRYSGIPSAIKVFFNLYGVDNKNKVRIEHSDAGEVDLYLYDDDEVLIYGEIINLGSWLPAAETKYNLKLLVNYAVGTVYLYINNNVFGSITDLPIAEVKNTWLSLWIGQNAENPTYTSNASFANFSLVRDIISVILPDETTINNPVKLNNYKATSGTYFVKTDVNGNLQILQYAQDETNATIKTKLGAASQGNDGYLTSVDYSKLYPIFFDYGTLHVGDSFVFNGSLFKAQQVQSTSGSMVIFYFNPAINKNTNTENSLLVRSLGIAPVVNTPTTDSVALTSLNQSAAMCAYKSSDIISTVFPAGAWEFSVVLFSNNISEPTHESGIVTSGFNCFNSFCTADITGTGTTRSVSVTAGQNFINTDYVITEPQTSYVETPKGLYPIVGYTSGTEISIKVPSAYVNESGININLWRNIFSQVSDKIESTVPARLWHTVSSARYDNATYNNVGIIVYGATNYVSNVTVSLQYGEPNTSQTTSPFIYGHDQLPDIKGGDTNGAWHVTQSQLSSISSLPATFVSSFKTRTGAVAPASGDYTPGMVGAEPASANLSSVAGLTYANPAFVRMTGTNMFSLDQSSYLPASISNAEDNQIIRRVGSVWVNGYPQLIPSVTGAISQPVITVLSDVVPTINIASTGYVLYQTTDYTGDSRVYTITASGLILLDGVNYVYASYNSGSPVIATTASYASVNGSNIVLIAEIFVDGANVYPYKFYVNNRSTSHSAENDIINRMYDIDRFKISNGMVLGTSGTSITMTAGDIWDGSKKISKDAYNSSGAGQNDNYVWYYINGNWTYLVGQSGFYTLSYQSPSSSANITVGRYAVNWVFRDIQKNIGTGVQQERLHIFLGRGDYTYNEALAAQISEIFNTTPSAPSYILSRAVFVGKIIILKSATTAAKVVTNGRVGNYYNNTLKGQGSITDPYGVDIQNVYIEQYLTDAANINWDLSVTPTAKLTLGGNRILSAPTNGVDGMHYELSILQGVTPYSLTFDAAYRWQNGVTPALSNTANALDVLTFKRTNGFMVGSIKRFP